MAGLLTERGVRAGDRVAIVLPNIGEFAAVYYGVLRAGAVVVPMNPLLKAREVAYHLADSGAAVIFTGPMSAAEVLAAAATAGAQTIVVDPAFADMLSTATPVDGVVDRDGADTAVILYTSGTTGTPKGAELTHDNLSRNAQVVDGAAVPVDRGRCGLRRASVVPFVRPDLHAQRGCRRRRVSDAAAAVRSGAGAGESSQTHRVTVLAAVPTMYGALLAVPDRDGYDVSALRVCLSGGAALPVEVLRAFDDAFGCQVLEGYGLSETSPVASFNHPDRPRKAGSIGTPIEGVDMRVLDVDGREVAQGAVGEIAIRGHNVMKGYWRRPEATATAIPDGWFRTGDLGRVDEDGYFFIVDRKKDMIIRGGYNVYPREIEEVLYEHPDVAEAAVIGLPDPLLGEEVAPRWRSSPARPPPSTSSAPTSRRRSPPTSTRGTCGSSTPSRRARPARSSSGRSSRPPS